MADALHDRLSCSVERYIQPLSQFKPLIRDIIRAYRTPPFKDPIQSAAHAWAYAAYRMPATSAVIKHVIDKLPPAFQPRTLLDFGAGPATATLNIAHHFSTLETASLIEHNPHMQHVGAKLLEGEAPKLATSWQSNLPLNIEAPSDLVVSAYAFGENGDQAQRHLLNQLMAHTGHMLILIMPGTPAGFEILRHCRQQAIAASFYPLAPCNHAGICPMQGEDWCHFSTRLPRSRAHTYLKDGALGYEDEKFCYLILSKHPPIGTQQTAGRILKPPHCTNAGIHLSLCRPVKPLNSTIPRRDKSLYKMAKKKKWGDLWPLT